MAKRKKTEIVVRNHPRPEVRENLPPRPASMLPLKTLLTELASRYSHSVFVGWLNPPNTPPDTLRDPDLFTVETTGHPDAAPYLMGMAQRQLDKENGIIDVEHTETDVPHVPS